MIVLDTNVLSALMTPGRYPAVESWLAIQTEADLYLSVITEAELRQGVLALPAGKRRDTLAADVELTLIDFSARVLSVDRAVAAVCASVINARRMIGRPIQFADALIAATCKIHGAMLATHNTRDFEGCDIALIDPFSFTE
jgi:toxin FitB